MNVLASPASPSHSIASAFDPLSSTSFPESSSSAAAETRSPPPAASSGASLGGGAAAAAPTGGAALGRKNTLKAYLANKHKLKERQAINIVTNNNPTGSTAQDAPGSPEDAMSPRTASRMEQSLEDLDRQKNKIEESLSAITKEMLHYQPGHHYTTATGASILSSPTDGITPSLFDASDAPKVDTASSLPGVRPLAELQQSKAALVAQLDQIIKERRALLQSWSRDYKNLKRSGSLKQPSPENYWFSPN